MKKLLDGIMKLKAFTPVLDAMKKADREAGEDIEHTLAMAVQDSHEKIRMAGANKKTLAIALLYELRAIDQFIASRRRVSDEISAREGKLWQHAIVATECFFDSIEHGLNEFFAPVEKEMLNKLKKEHAWYEDLTDGTNTIWEGMFGSKEDQTKSTLVGKLIHEHLSPTIIKKNLEHIFNEANKTYHTKWQAVVKDQSSALLVDNKSYSELDVLGAHQAYNPSSAEITGLVGFSAAVIGTVSLAAGWHTLSYAMLSVFPPVAIFTVMATFGLAVWNEDKALEKKEKQIRGAIKGIHRQLLLQVDITPIKELEGKSIRQAMQKNSETIVKTVTQAWRKTLLGDFDATQFEALSSAAKRHTNLIASCLSELDDKIPDDHKLYRRKEFRPVCSTKIFSLEETSFLKSYGSWLVALASGKIQPYTKEQKHFVQMVNGEEEPNTEQERIWWRYMERCKLEAKGEY